MAINNITIQVILQAQQATNQANQFNQAMGQMGQAAQKAGQQGAQGISSISVAVNDASKAIGNMAAALAGLAAIRLGRNMMETADAINRVEIGFKAMTHSAETAAHMMDQLRDLARDSPFAFQTLADGARQLQAFGFQTKDIPRDIRAISEAVKTIGGGSEQIEQLTYALGIMREKGVAQAQQLFRQIAAKGIDVMKFIREQLEKETGQVLDDTTIRQLMAKGRLAGEGTAEVLLRGLDKIPKSTEDMMQLTTSHLQKMQDEWGFLARKVIDDVGPGIIAMLDKINAAMKYLEEHKAQREAAEGFGLVTTAVVALAIVVKSLQTLGLDVWFMRAIGVLKTFTSAAGLAETALISLTAAAVGLGAVAVFKEFGPKITDDQQDSWIAAAKNLWLLVEAGLAFVDAFTRAEAVRFFPPKAPTPQEARETLLRPNQVGPGLPGAGFMAPTAPTDEELAKIKEASLGEIKILQMQKELAHSQIEAAKAVLARAQEAETKGLNAIQIRFDHQVEAMEAAAREVLQDVPPEARANLEKARQIELNTFIRNEQRKTYEQGLQEDKKYLETQLELAKYNTQIEADMALAVIQDTAQKEAGAQIHRLDIIKEGAEKERLIRLSIADDNYRIASRKTEDFIADELRARKLSFDQIVQLWKIAEDMRARDQDEYLRETEKAEIESARMVAQVRAEITKQAAQQTSQYLKSIIEDERQARVASAERQVAIGRMAFENGEAQNARQRIDAITKATQYDLAQVDRVAQVKTEVAYETALDEYNAKIDMEQAFLRDAKRLRDGGYEQAARDAENAAQQQYDLAMAIQQKFYVNDKIAAGEAQDAKTMLVLRAQKEMNDAWLAEQRQIFEKFESGVGRVFDALFERGKSFWARIGDMALQAGKQALKSIVVPAVSASLMTAMGMPVSLESRGDFGSGTFAQFARLFTKHPVFQNLPTVEFPPMKIDKTITPDGQRVRVEVDKWPFGAAKVQADVRSTNTTTINGGNLPMTTGYSQSWLGPLIASALSGGSSSGGGGGGESVQAGAISTALKFAGGDETYTTYGETSGYRTGSSGGFSLGSAALGLGGGGGGFSLGSAALGSAAMGLGSIPGVSGTLGGNLMSLPIMMAQAPKLFGALQATGGIKAALAGLAPALGIMGGIAGVQGGFSLARLGQNTGHPVLGGILGGGLGAIGGMLAFGGLAHMFPILAAAGPWGLVAAAAIGATIALIGAFKESDEQHARKLIKQMYGIDIPNRNILQSVVQIAKQKYGGAISLAVASPEVQQLVNLYAASQALGVVGPRPMYSATLNQSASGLQIQPVYSNGQLVNSPYSGTTTYQQANAAAFANSAPGQSNIFVQLDPSAAAKLFAGQVVNVINQNPTVVGSANTAAINSGSSRSAQLGGLMEPFTVHA